MDIPSSSSSPRDSLSSRQENSKLRRIDSSTTRSQESELGISKLSDSVLLVSDPAIPQVDVVFFHGLQHEHTGGLDVHLSTWTCKHDSTTIWPQRWLQKQGARVFFIKYDASLQKTDSKGRMDLTIIVENLLTELGWAFHIGQESSNTFRPIIFVGHSFGGLVIKQLCIHASERELIASRDRFEERLLKSIKGILFCGTPHLGSEMLAGMAKKIMNRSPLLPFVELLSTGVARQGEKFRSLASKANWEIFSIGEAFATEMKTHGCHTVTGDISSQTIVEEGSARLGQNYITVSADHLSLCKPGSKQSNMFQHLVKLIEHATVQQLQVQETPAPGASTQCHARRKKSVSTDLVGTESRLKVIIAEIEHGRSFVGFCGMGGVGKTTFAKLLYNEINAGFEYACFVDKVKEMSGNMKKVKEEVWKQMNPRPEGEYIENRWDEMTKRKLLVIFDDVEKTEDVELLDEIAKENDAEGGCFVVTSRDEGLFDLFGDKIYVCRVPVLGREHARQLFITHAFPGKNKPPSELEEIVAEIVERCDGLPLTLEVIGRLQRRKTDKRMWEEIPKALQAVDSRRFNGLEEQVWGKLRVSIDNLGTEELEMFLDAAAVITEPGEYKYFGTTGWRYGSFSVEDMMTAWSSMYGYARNRWQVLIDRSLVYSGKMNNKEGQFQPCMHEHLRTLGIRIALEKGRIIDRKSLDGNYKGIRGLENVIFHQIVVANEYKEYNADCCDDERPCQMRTASSVMSRLKELRYLVFSNTCFHKPCKRCAERPFQLPPKITMLSWASVDTTFACSTLNELLVLRVSSFPVPSFPVPVMKQFNPAHTSSRGLQNHDTIPLPEESSTTLAEEGDFVNLWPLDRSLTTPDSLPESFGQLVHLQSSDVGDKSFPNARRNSVKLELPDLVACQRLKALPESFVRFPQLRTLRIVECGYLEAFPLNFGSLAKLELLEMRHCHAIQSLPDSLRQLPNLRELSISHCENLQGLLDCSGTSTKLEKLYFPKLELLTLDNCKQIRSLPNSFSQLLHLKGLNIRDCAEFLALPSSFGNLANLEQLHLSVCEKLQSLPESFGRLLHLKELKMKRCSELQALPSSFGNLANLDLLHLSECKKLQSLPESFGHLCHLKELKMDCCSVLQALPRSFGNLANLDLLHLSECEKLQSLPESFGLLLHLKELNMNRCSELQGLPSSFGNLANLEQLNLSRCKKLQSLAESFPLLLQPKKLEMYGYSEMQTLPDSFGNLANMDHLNLIGCMTLQSLPESFGYLLRLKELDMYCCSELQTLPNSFGNLGNLEQLNLSWCQTLKALPESFGRLLHLKKLEMYACSELQALPNSFGNLVNLEQLDLSWCKKLQALPESLGGLLQALPSSFGNLANLEQLNLSGCKKLQALPESFGLLLHLKELKMNCCSELQALPSSFGNLANLDLLHLSECEKLQSLPESLGHLLHLRELEMCDCSELRDLASSFGNLANLEQLNLSGCRKLQSLPESFGRLLHLNKLEMEHCPELQALVSNFGNLANLDHLDLSWCRKL